jgi:hypothetical protein
MRARENTFIGCPLSYLHPQAIPVAPRFSGKLHRRRAGVQGGGEGTNSWVEMSGLKKLHKTRLHPEPSFTTEGEEDLACVPLRALSSESSRSRAL